MTEFAYSAPQAPNPFLRCAELLLPADHEQAGIVVSHEWTLPELRDTPICVWGHQPDDGSSSRVKAMTAAVKRAAGIHRMHKIPDVAAIHRVPAVAVSHGHRAEFSRRLRAGALVELHTEPVSRVIDAVFAQAGGVGDLQFRPDGSVSAIIMRRTGEDVLLRTCTGLLPNADALEYLSTQEFAPRLVARGSVAGARWSTESLLEGRRPRRLGSDLGSEIAAFCANLPRHHSAPTAPSDDLDALREFLPRHGGLWSFVRRTITASLPDTSIVRHGDLWIGNVLTVNDRLSGIVDWDAWHPKGMPGTDLLQLIASDSSNTIGAAWHKRPWTTDAFAAISRPYFEALAMTPDEKYLKAIGLGWWVGQTAATLRRDPDLATNERWTSQNVDAVAQELG